MTQREQLLELISKLPDDKLQAAYWAIERLTSDWSEKNERGKRELLKLAGGIESPLHDVQRAPGSRPVAGGGGISKDDEAGGIVDAVFTQHWYEDNDDTMVQQINWVFRRQGFLITHRMHLSKDGASYLCSEQIAGPQRTAVHEERFPVSALKVESKGSTRLEM